MTKKELSQLYYLTQELEWDKQELDELKEQKETADSMMRRADIANLQAIIQLKSQLRLYERNRLENYIQTIPDSLVRQIFRMRFKELMTYQQIAVKLKGVSAESVRKTIERYLKDNK